MLPPLLPSGLGGLVEGLALPGDRQSKTLCETAAEWGTGDIAEGTPKSENMEIYSSFRFLRGHGLWNASEMLMSSF